MKRYPSHFQGPHTAPGRCLQLLEQSAPEAGIVLDLGCGRAPLAELIAEKELDYVGTDIDADGLAEVRGRGFETHQLDLGLAEPELPGALRKIVAGRRIAAVLAVDVLEHLVHPDALLRALRSLHEQDPAWPLIVSIPNVTHLDIASKLLLGRWDLTSWGLLDDTHLRFFSERAVARLFAGNGWVESGASDVTLPESEQLFPPDAPLLRPGAPARELLRRLRSDAEPNARTYQFVRSFLPAEPAAGHSWTVEPEADQERIFASVLVADGERKGPDAQRLRNDLAEQTLNDFETVSIGGRDADAWNQGLSEARGRYICFAAAGVRLSPRWLQSFQEFPEALGGQVLRVNAVAVPRRRSSGGASAETLIESGRPLALSPLDLLDRERGRPIVASAYAVPAQAARAGGLGFGPGGEAVATAVFLHRAAELCGVLALNGVTVGVEEIGGGERELAPVAEALDRSPLILPAGSASRILELRRPLHQSLASRATRILRALRRRLRRR